MSRSSQRYLVFSFLHCPYNLAQISFWETDPIIASVIPCLLSLKLPNKNHFFFQEESSCFLILTVTVTLRKTKLLMSKALKSKESGFFQRSRRLIHQTTNISGPWMMLWKDPCSHCIMRTLWIFHLHKGLCTFLWWLLPYYTLTRTILNDTGHTTNLFSSRGVHRASRLKSLARISQWKKSWGETQQKKKVDLVDLKWLWM